MDLCSLIDRNAAFSPDKPAIHFAGESLSYGAFAARIEQTIVLAHQLNHARNLNLGQCAALHFSVAGRPRCRELLEGSEKLVSLTIWDDQGTNGGNTVCTARRHEIA